MSTRHSEIWAAVAALPPSQRAAVVLRFAVDLRYREVGEALGTSEEAARQSVHEGLKKLRATRRRPEGDGEMSEFVDRLMARADEDGLLDVAYATLDTPLGTAMVAATPRGLVRLALPTRTSTRCSTGLAADVSPRLLEYPARLDQARRELDEYFERPARPLRAAARLAPQPPRASTGGSCGPPRGSRSAR